MTRYITHYHCGKCNGDISRNWVIRGGLKLICPQCNVTYDPPSSLNPKLKCDSYGCEQYPSFILWQTDAYTTWCMDCAAKEVVSYIRGLITPGNARKVRRIGIILSLLSVVSYLISGVLYLINRPTGNYPVSAILLFIIGAPLIVSGLYMTLFSKSIAKRKTSHAEDILRILKENVSQALLEVLLTTSDAGKRIRNAREILSLFDLEPGKLMTSSPDIYAARKLDHWRSLVGRAPKQVRPASTPTGQCQSCGKPLLTEKGVVLTSPDGVSQVAQQMLARRCECVNCGAVFCLECGNAEGYKRGTGATHCPRCGTQVPIEQLI